MATKISVSEGAGHVASSCDEWLSSYQTPQTVTIRNKWLKVPHLCITIAVAMYIVIYKIMIMKAFMLYEDIHGNAYGFLSYPMELEEYFTCNDGDFDCERKPPPKDISYCKEDFLKTQHPGSLGMHGVKHVRNISSCWMNDIHMDAGPIVFIPTMKTFINQTWDYDKKEWMNDQILEVYMEDIESFYLRLQSSFRAGVLKMKEESVNLMGGITLTGRGDIQEEECYIPCIPTKKEKFDVECATQEHSSYYMKSCGHVLKNASRGDVFASKWGDTLTVRMILELAGLDLDRPRDSMGGVSYRQSGGVIDLRVNYQNMKSFGWVPWLRSFLDTTITYSYEVTQSEDFSGSTVYSTKVIEGKNPHTLKRALERTTGLRVQLHASGVLAGFKLGQCLTTLAVTTSLFAVSVIVVETFLVWLYRTCGHADLLTAVYMFDVYKKDDSLDSATFHEVLRQQNPDAYDGYKAINKEENLLHEAVREKKKEQYGNNRQGGATP